MSRAKTVAKLFVLRNLLNEPDDRIIARQQGQAFTVRDLRMRAHAWLAILEPHSGERWAVYHRDAFEFLAILQALWHLERTACVPGDNRPGTVQRLSDGVGGVDGFVGDFQGVPTNSTYLTEQSDTALLVLPRWLELNADFPALEIYTSGSTGQPKPISKSFQQIESEVETLEQQWPRPSQNLCNSVVLATVSHQHLYGMTFRLFWPLASGRPFERTLCEYTEDVFHQAVNYEAFSLVSSPSHLGRMNTSVYWSELAGRCEMVISSAAPLHRGDSLKVGELLDTSVREIYGSSETGAIAWRCQQQSEREAFWSALPGVHLLVGTEGETTLKCPYLEDKSGITLADKISVNPDGSFCLEGRIDSIVKVEGKRISLLEIERLLLENSQVKFVKALTIERKRIEIAVVIELSAQGAEQLQNSGRKSLIKTLKALLAEHLEAVLLPRRWRFVTQMPYNTQGKLPLDTLRSMFEKEPVKWPEIVSEQVQKNDVLLVCDIPAGLIYFDGHFSGNPILPGIVQVHWAEAFGRRLLPLQGCFARLENIKFQRVIVPASQVILNLRYDEVKQKLSFEYRSEKGVHSSGRICFE